MIITRSHLRRVIKEAIEDALLPNQIFHIKSRLESPYGQNRGFEERYYTFTKKDGTPVTDSDAKIAKSYIDWTGQGGYFRLGARDPATIEAMSVWDSTD